MPQVPCRFCGLPFKVRRVEAGRAYYCCSGCALVSRLPPGGVEGRYPVTPALIAALVVGFGYFNEMLFWTLALEIAREQRPETAQVFARLSAGLGLFVWAALVAGLWRAAAHQWSDALVALATLALVVAAVRPGLSPGGLVGANAALALWVARGWGKQKTSPKPPVPI
jgi:hypothetical protein